MVELEFVLHKSHTQRIIDKLMESSDYTRYTDALLLLSLRSREVDGEDLIISTSCLSSALMSDLILRGYIDNARQGGKYMITDKGKQLLYKHKEVSYKRNYMYRLSPGEDGSIQLEQLV